MIHIKWKLSFKVFYTDDNYNQMQSKLKLVFGHNSSSHNILQVTVNYLCKITENLYLTVKNTLAIGGIANYEHLLLPQFFFKVFYFKCVKISWNDACKASHHIKQRRFWSDCRGSCWSRLVVVISFKPFPSYDNYAADDFGRILSKHRKSP